MTLIHSIFFVWTYYNSSKIAYDQETRTVNGYQVSGTFFPWHTKNLIFSMGSVHKLVRIWSSCQIPIDPGCTLQALVDN